jgi:AmmeMemoRadiSam system protein B
MRAPAVADMFYPGDKEELNDLIRSCFMSKFGPGAMPGKKDKSIKAVIVPHAGFSYSGPCAAFAYKSIAESKDPDLFILLGPSHSGFISCVSLEDWKTPLGIVKNDKEFGKVFIKNSGLPQDEDAHANEHSIEVQLPFLQFVVDNPKICPIMITNNSDPKKIADAVNKTLEQTKKKAIIICSSDFTHLGSNYGYAPFKDDIKKKMYALDKEVIGFIKELDCNGLLNYIDKTGATICGKFPINVLLHVFKKADINVLKYYTSADITDSGYDMAVGYAALEFK